jgi:foldase protein PrsA
VRRLSQFFAAPVVALALLATACGSISAYAAKVDGESVSVKDLNDELRSIAANGPFVKLVESNKTVKGTGVNGFDQAFTREVLTRQIFYRLVDAELSRRKLTLTPADLSAAREVLIENVQGEDIFNEFPDAYKDLLIHRQAQVDQLTLALNDLKGTAEEAAKAYYDSHKDEFATACVSHILVENQIQADDVKARLAKGEDFAAVAKAESKDSGSAAKGGDLGCDVNASAGLVAEFLLAALNQPVGEAGAPVRTQFGFHIIKVTAREVPPFDKVKDDARQKVAQSGQEKLLTWLQETIAKAKIEVNPKYGTFDKEGTTPGVVALPESGENTPAGSAKTVPGPAGGATPP